MIVVLRVACQVIGVGQDFLSFGMTKHFLEDKKEEFSELPPHCGRQPGVFLSIRVVAWFSVLHRCGLPAVCLGHPRRRPGTEKKEKITKYWAIHFFITVICPARL